MIIRINGKRVRDTSKILPICTLIINLLFLVLLIISNLLPVKFLAFLLFLFIVIDGLLTIFGIIKTIDNKIYRIIYNILISIILLISVIGNLYLFKTIFFISKIHNNGYKIENYSIIVLKNNKIDNIKDIEHKKVGVLEDDNPDINIVKQHINNKIQVNYKKYTTIEALSEDLLNNEIEIIIIENSYKNILEDEQEFKNLTKNIYSFSIKIKTDDISKNIDLINNPFSIYISGIDTKQNITSSSRSDVNMVLIINPKTYQVLLVSIPRDYYVKLHNTVGYRDKISHAGIYGIDKSVKTIEELLKININYYVKVNFNGLINLVDSLGGINIYSEYDFISYSGYSFNKGNNYVNGKKALDFARTRKAFATGDRQRGKNQQEVIKGIINKITSYTILTKYNLLLDNLEGCFETNIEQKEISNLVRFQLDKNPNWNINTMSLDGKDSHQYTYTYNKTISYVMIPYKESLEKATEEINKILLQN